MSIEEQLSTLMKNYIKLQAKNKTLKQSCKDHAELARQRLVGLQKVEAKNKRLRQKLRIALETVGCSESEVKQALKGD